MFVYSEAGTEDTFSVVSRTGQVSVSMGSKSKGGHNGSGENVEGTMRIWRKGFRL